jgi:hypothetical protein
MTKRDMGTTGLSCDISQYTSVDVGNSSVHFFQMRSYYTFCELYAGVQFIVTLSVTAYYRIVITCYLLYFTAQIW